MKATLIERGIVTFDGQGAIRVAAPGRTSSSGTSNPRASTQSEAEFYDMFGTKFPSQLGELKNFLSGLGTAGISVEFRRSAVLRFFPNPDFAASAGFIDAAGQVWFNDAWSAARKCDRVSAAYRYLQAVAASTGGKVLPATEKELRVCAAGALYPKGGPDFPASSFSTAWEACQAMRSSALTPPNLGRTASCGKAERDETRVDAYRCQTVTQLSLAFGLRRWHVTPPFRQNRGSDCFNLHWEGG